MRLPIFNSLVVELTSECNRACPWCMRQGDLVNRRFTDDGQRVRGKMPTEQAHRIMTEARDMGFRGQVTFYLMSEPFLDNRIIDMATFARKLGLVPYVNTNGDVLLNRPGLAKASGEAFSWVEVTIYEADNKKATAIKNKLSTSIGPRARFKSLSAMGPRPHVPRIGTAQTQAACRRPMEKLIVQYDGSSPLCCYDINTEFDLPNAFDVSVEKLWHSTARTRVAQTLSNKGGRTNFALCSTCPMPETGYPPPFEAI